MRGAHHLTDREILLLTAERVERIDATLAGPPSLADRLTIIETRMAERLPATKREAAGAAAGVSALVAAVVMGVLEAFRKASS
jgi:hypothetical protein